MGASRYRRQDGTRFYLTTLHYSIPASALLDDERLRELAAEDAAWCASRADWEARAPHFWQWRRLHHWNAEHAELLVVRDALRRRARALGLPT
jgi:hypothetical protein